MRLRVLALDIEGGHGGSSRSLFTAIQHLDLKSISIEVWCKRGGIIEKRYADIGVPVRVCPEMPKVSALQRFSRNVHSQLRFLYQFSKATEFRRTLLKEINLRFDVVHCNHEALAYLGVWMRFRTHAALVFHNRTMLWNNVFGWCQVRLMDHVADRLVFITENEEKNVRNFGANTSGDVIYNPVSVESVQLNDDKQILSDERFKVCCLSNYSWVRGLDRFVEIAQILKRQGRNDVVFVIAGDIKLPKNLPGDIGVVASRGGSLSDYAVAKGVSDMFVFLGHVSDPNWILASCDIVARPSRIDNPWGRDLLEGMIMGKPCIALGAYQGFIINGETGYLLARYSPESFADQIAYLADNPVIVRRLGISARKLVKEKCNPAARAKDLAMTWQAAVQSREQCILRRSG